MNAVEVIRRKRDGKALSDAEIDWLVQAYTRATWPTTRCPRS